MLCCLMMNFSVFQKWDTCQALNSWFSLWMLWWQVHITQGDYDGKAVIISWVTPDEPGSSNVQYGTSGSNLDFIAEGTVSNYSFFKYNSGYIHHCLIDGLEVSYYFVACYIWLQQLNSLTFFPFTSVSCLFSSNRLLYAIQYDKSYFYKIGSGDSSRKFWFHTPPMIHPDSSYKFGIIGWLFLSCGWFFSSVFVMNFSDLVFSF